MFGRIHSAYTRWALQARPLTRTVIAGLLWGLFMTPFMLLLGPPRLLIILAIAVLLFIGIVFWLDHDRASSRERSRDRKAAEDSS